MRILVTGGAGFMGKTVVTNLLAHNYPVRVLDKAIDNLKGIQDSSLELMQGGIEDGAKVKEAVSGCDVIYHLAETFSGNPFEVLDIDIKGNLNLLKEAKEQNVKQYLFFSTHRVYGCPRQKPLNEEHPTNPEESGRAIYASAKLANEKFCLTYFQEQGLPVTIFRFWWAVSDELGGRVLRNLIDSALKGETIRVPEKAGGNFLHNEDAALALMLATLKKEAFGQVFNISSGTYTTWKEIAELIIEQTGGKSKLELLPQNAPAAGTIIASDRSIAYECDLDIGKARQRLGFRPLYSPEKLNGIFRESMKNLVEARKKAVK